MTSPREALGAVYAAAGARDWDAVERLIHPDFVLYEAPCLPFGGLWRGKNALKACAEAMYGTWAKAEVEIHDITGGDTYGVVVLTLTMTSKRTGETFAQSVNEMGRFEDGLLKELRIHYFDPAEVAAKA